MSPRVRWLQAYLLLACLACVFALDRASAFGLLIAMGVAAFYISASLTILLAVVEFLRLRRGVPEWDSYRS